MRIDVYRNDTLNGEDTTVDNDLEDTLEELAVETPTDKELANLQRMLQTPGGIANFFDDM